MSDTAIGIRQVICPKCNGERYVRNRGEQWFFGLFTFGLGPAIDAVVNPDAKDSVFGRKCPTCSGQGFIVMASRLTTTGDR